MKGVRGEGVLVLMECEYGWVMDGVKVGDKKEDAGWCHVIS